ncbi:MAG TPA: hypothetical protein PLS12_09390, partial [Bacteroidales bacterium]|nr:hypothetical protein [Bacteroidales bacterium]
MQSIELQGQLRTAIGKSESKLNRVSGSIPCVLYGGKENIHFTVDEIAFSKVYITPIVYVVNLSIDGKSYKAIIKNIQFHPVTDKVLHVDFYEILDTKESKNVEESDTRILQNTMIWFITHPNLQDWKKRCNIATIH